MSQVLALPVAPADGTEMNQTLRSETRSRSVRLAALPSAVPWARRVVRHTLRGWRLESLSDPVLLLVSELVTNAVEASKTVPCLDQAGHPMISLTVELRDASLLVKVWDADPGLPVLQEADLTGDRGRGLVLVDFLADAWGHHDHEQGKVVWCEIGRGSVPPRD